MSMLQNRGGGGDHSHLQQTSIRITNIHDPKDKKQAQTENTLGVYFGFLFLQLTLPRSWEPGNI